MSDAPYVTLPIFEETGYVILDAYDQAQDPREWEDLTFVDWKSSGETRFAPLASAYGDMECNGFWNHTPPKTDKDGVWVPANVEVAPRLVARAQEPGANIGRCRVIELMPNTYGDTLYNHFYSPNSKQFDCGNGSHNYGLTAARSRHIGGVTTLLGDGSVRFVGDNVDLAIWRGSATRSGGEVLGEF